MVLACRLVVARAHARPRRQVLGGREPTHVDTDLADDDLGANPVDAWDGVEQLDRLTGPQPSVHPL
jgi:hypothetical protein